MTTLWAAILVALVAGAHASECDEAEGCAPGESALLQLRHRDELTTERSPNAHHHGAGGHPHLGGLRVPVQEFLWSFTDAASSTHAFIALQQPGLPQEAGCDQGNISALLPFEQWAIWDYPNNVSTWGHLCFDTTQGATNALSQSYWILGMKALSNFNYAYCKFGFDTLLEYQPDFIMGYWGRAMCDAQLIWNSENPQASQEMLKKGRAVQEELNLTLSDFEEGFYAAGEALNDYEREWEECKPGIEGTMPCRYKAFAKACMEQYKSYPENPNTGAYVVLSSLAVGCVSCTETGPGQCKPAEEARKYCAELLLQPAYKTNPAFLHYCMHAHDYPYAEIYLPGVPFAEAYPKVVNGSVHSLHMPSHIFMRTGDFAGAAAANHHSMNGGDLFANFKGALRYLAGPVGSSDWLPGTDPSGYGFAWDAGNLYHSLEYEAYEVLQGCNFRRVAREVERMGIAAFQAVAMGGGETIQMKDGQVTNLGAAWFNATTYYGWLYRMQARLSQEASLNGLLGGVGSDSQPLASLGAGGTNPMASSMPLPLAWEGSTDYTNWMYAPQSEAGLWNAIALGSLLGGAEQTQALFARAANGTTTANLQAALSAPLGKPRSSMSLDPWAAGDEVYPWEGVCGSALPDEIQFDSSDIGCAVEMAQQRISEVHQFYISKGTWYEGNLTAAVWLEVAAIASLAKGDLAGAITMGRKASAVEWGAVSILLPSSTSVYFVPGTAFYGVLALRAATTSNLNAEFVQELLGQAAEAFDKCLAPQGRPKLSMCLLGQARTQQLLGQKGNAALAAKSYTQLLANYNRMGAAVAKEDCKGAYGEAAQYLAKKG